MAAPQKTQIGASETPITDRDDGMGEECGALDSPKRARKSPDVGAGVTVDLLRQLLAEQQEAISLTVTQAVSELEQRQGARLQKLENQLGMQTDQMNDLSAQCKRDRDHMLDYEKQMNGAVDMIQQRLAKLEKGDSASTTATGATEDERRQTTLVFGGFRRDTKRTLIVTAVQQGIKDLQLEADVDRDCFATGPRRSFCLLPFFLRKNEHMGQLKERMRKVMMAFQQKRIPIEGHDRTIWCTFSKPRDARERSGHCRTIRAAVYAFNRDKIEEVDSDYTTGTTWIGQSMLGSAVTKPPHPDHRVHTIDGKTCRPWVDLTALSEETQADMTELEEFFQKPSRN